MKRIFSFVVALMAMQFAAYATVETFKVTTTSLTGAGSLTSSLASAEASEADTAKIVFDFSSDGEKVIQLESAITSLTSKVLVVDASTSKNPIVLDGGDKSINGFQIKRATIIKGLTFNNFDNAIYLTNGMGSCFYDCDFANNNIGIYTNGYITDIENCVFGNNKTGLWVESQVTNVKNCVFGLSRAQDACAENDCGVRLEERGNITNFTDNVLAANGVGLQLAVRTFITNPIVSCIFGVNKDLVCLENNTQNTGIYSVATNLQLRLEKCVFSCNFEALYMFDETNNAPGSGGLTVTDCSFNSNGYDISVNTPNDSPLKKMTIKGSSFGYSTYSCIHVGACEEIDLENNFFGGDGTHYYPMGDRVEYSVMIAEYGSDNFLYYLTAKNNVFYSNQGLYIGSVTPLYKSLLSNNLFYNTNLAYQLPYNLPTPVISSAQVSGDDIVVKGYVDTAAVANIELFFTDQGAQTATEFVTTFSTEEDGTFSVKIPNKYVGKRQVAFCATATYDEKKTSRLSAPVSLSIPDIDLTRLKYYVKVDGTGDGSSWEKAMSPQSFAYALPRVKDDVTFYVAEGTYYPIYDMYNRPADLTNSSFVVNSDVSIKGGYSAKAVTGAVSDPSQYKTIFCGDFLGDNEIGDDIWNVGRKTLLYQVDDCSRLFLVKPSVKSLNPSSFTYTLDESDTQNYFNMDGVVLRGGGTSIYGVGLDLNITLTNSLVERAGYIYMYVPNNSLTIDNCKFHQVNRAVVIESGKPKEVKIYNTTFDDCLDNFKISNSENFDFSGHIHFESDTFVHNDKLTVEVLGISLEMNKCKVSENNALYFHFIHDTVDVKNCSFDNNNSTYMFLDLQACVSSFEKCSFVKNSASWIINNSSPDRNFRVRYSVFDSNTTQSSLIDGAGNESYSNSSFINNDVASGNYLINYGSGRAEFYNNTFAGNIVPRIIQGDNRKLYNNTIVGNKVSSAILSSHNIDEYTDMYGNIILGNGTSNASGIGYDNLPLVFSEKKNIQYNLMPIIRTDYQSEGADNTTWTPDNSTNIFVRPFSLGTNESTQCKACSYAYSEYEEAVLKSIFDGTYNSTTHVFSPNLDRSGALPVIPLKVDVLSDGTSIRFPLAKTTVDADQRGEKRLDPTCMGAYEIACKPDTTLANDTIFAGEKFLDKTYTIVGRHDSIFETIPGESGCDNVVMHMLVVKPNPGVKEYYVKIERHGTGDGSSWENAMNGEDFALYLPLAPKGATFYVAEGTYNPVYGMDLAESKSPIYTINNDVTIRGGYPANAVTGAASEPDKYKTIFDGDLLGDDEYDEQLDADGYPVINKLNTAENASTLFLSVSQGSLKARFDGVVLKNVNTAIQLINPDKKLEVLNCSFDHNVTPVSLTSEKDSIYVYNSSFSKNTGNILYLPAIQDIVLDSVLFEGNASNISSSKSNLIYASYNEKNEGKERLSMNRVRAIGNKANFNAYGYDTKVENSLFEANMTTDLFRVLSNNKTFEIRKSKFIQNIGKNGGIINSDEKIIIDSCLFEKNDASNWNLMGQSSTNDGLYIQHSEFLGNKSTDLIKSDAKGDIVISNCNIAENQAGEYLFNIRSSESTALYKENSICGNTTGSILRTAGGTHLLENNTMASNKVTRYMLNASGGNLQLNNNTIVGNDAELGLTYLLGLGLKMTGNIILGNTPEAINLNRCNIKDCEFKYNIAPSIEFIDDLGHCESISDISSNNIFSVFSEEVTCDEFAEIPNRNEEILTTLFSGTYNSTTGLFSPEVKNNGGPTPTVALKTDMLSDGTSIRFPLSETSVTNDQRGVNRLEKTCMGAYEITCVPDTTLANDTIFVGEKFLDKTYTVVGRHDSIFETVPGESGCDDVVMHMLVVKPNPDVKEYYVKIERHGTGDGSSWENAMNGTDFATYLPLAPNGATFYVAEGTYKPEFGSDLKVPARTSSLCYMINSDVSIRGGYPADAETGAVSDPKQYETIFDGDILGNDVVDETLDADGYPLLEWTNREDNVSSLFLSNKVITQKLFFDGVVTKNAENSMCFVNPGKTVEVHNSTMLYNSQAMLVPGEGSVLNVSNTSFSKNFSGINAVECESATLDNVLFENNRGRLLNTYGSSRRGAVTLNNVQCLHNRCGEDLLLSNNHNVSVYDSYFEGNMGVLKAGANVEADAPAQLNVYKSDFKTNSGYSVYTFGMLALKIDSCSFVDNKSIVVDALANVENVTIEHSVFEKNMDISTVLYSVTADSVFFRNNVVSGNNCNNSVADLMSYKYCEFLENNIQGNNSPIYYRGGNEIGEDVSTKLYGNSLWNNTACSIVFTSGAGKTELSNNTIVSNEASEEFIYFNGAQAYLYNNTIVGNKVNPSVIDETGSSISMYGNIILGNTVSDEDKTERIYITYGSLGDVSYNIMPNVEMTLNPCTFFPDATNIVSFSHAEKAYCENFQNVVDHSEEILTTLFEGTYDKEKNLFTPVIKDNGGPTPTVALKDDHLTDGTSIRFPLTETIVTDDQRGVKRLTKTCRGAYELSCSADTTVLEIPDIITVGERFLGDVYNEVGRYDSIFENLKSVLGCDSVVMHTVVVENPFEGCEIGTVLFREDFGGNYISDPIAKSAGIPQCTYNYNENPKGAGNYAIRKVGWNHNQWYYPLYDHTFPDNGDRGYMMQVDGADDGGVFYNAQIDDLCPNTHLTLSMWGMSSTSTDRGDDAKLKMVVESLDGEVLATQDVLLVNKKGVWERFSVPYTVKEGQTSVVYKIINNGYTKDGNDFVLDDIEVRLCKPAVSVNSPIDSLCAGDDYVLTASYTNAGGYVEPLNFTWFKNDEPSYDLKGWTKVAEGQTLSFSDLKPEDNAYYRCVISSAGVPGEFNKCNSASDIVPILVKSCVVCVPDTTVLDNPDVIFVGEQFLGVTYTEAGRHDSIFENLKNINGCDSVVMHTLNVMLNPDAKYYYVKTERHGTGDGSSWENAMNGKDLTTYLPLAPDGSTFYVAEGSYKPECDEDYCTFTINSNVTVRGGYPADAKTGDISDPKKYKTVFNGDKKGDNVITKTTDETGCPVIEVENTDDDVYDMFSSSAERDLNVTLFGISIINSGHGYNAYTQSEGNALNLTIDNCKFENCRYGAVQSTYSGSLKATQSEFIQNGGCLLVPDVANVVMRDVKMENNYNNYLLQLYDNGSDVNKTVLMESVTATNNTAYLQTSGDVVVSNSTFDKNSCIPYLMYEQISSEKSSKIHISNSKFTDNNCNFNLIYANYSDVIVDTTLFQSNIVTSSMIYPYSLTMDSSKVIANKCGTGVLFEVIKDVRLTNDIINWNESETAIHIYAPTDDVVLVDQCHVELNTGRLFKHENTANGLNVTMTNSEFIGNATDEDKNWIDIVGNGKDVTVLLNKNIIRDNNISASMISSVSTDFTMDECDVYNDTAKSIMTFASSTVHVINNALYSNHVISNVIEANVCWDGVEIENNTIAANNSEKDLFSCYYTSTVYNNNTIVGNIVKEIMFRYPYDKSFIGNIVWGNIYSDFNYYSFASTPQYNIMPLYVDRDYSQADKVGVHIPNESNIVVDYYLDKYKTSEYEFVEEGLDAIKQYSSISDVFFGTYNPATSLFNPEIKNNGGFTPTIALKNDRLSDKTSIRFLLSETTVEQDQRGVARLVSTCMGAYEYIPSDPIECVYESILFKEDFGGNNPSDALYSENGLKEGLCSLPCAGDCPLALNDYMQTGCYALLKEAYRRHSGYMENHIYGGWYADFDDETHLGDIERGYFMSIDMASRPTTFYQREINDLCENTNLSLSMSARPLYASANTVLYMSVEDMSGNPLTERTEVVIDKSVNEWKEYSVTFSVPQGASSVMFKIYSEGGHQGNDFALDDIIVRLCKAQVDVNRPTGPLCKHTDYTLTASYSGDPSYLEPVNFTWFRNDKETYDLDGWVKVGTGKTYELKDMTSAVNGYYRCVVSSAGVEGEMSKCNSISAIVPVFVSEYTLEKDTVHILQGETYAGVTYDKVGVFRTSNREVNEFGCDRVVNRVIFVHPGGAEYYVTMDGRSAHTGVDWDNAIDSVEFATYLPLAKAGAVFHVAEGRYRPYFNSKYEKVSKRCYYEINNDVTIIGGYSKDELDEKVPSNPKKYRTIFTAASSQENNRMTEITSPRLYSMHIDNASFIGSSRGLFIANSDAKEVKLDGIVLNYCLGFVGDQTNTNLTLNRCSFEEMSDPVHYVKSLHVDTCFFRKVSIGAGPSTLFGGVATELIIRNTTITDILGGYNNMLTCDYQGAYPSLFVLENSTLVNNYSNESLIILPSKGKARIVNNTIVNNVVGTTMFDNRGNNVPIEITGNLIVGNDNVSDLAHICPNTNSSLYKYNLLDIQQVPETNMKMLGRYSSILDGWNAGSAFVPTLRDNGGYTQTVALKSDRLDDGISIIRLPLEKTTVTADQRQYKRFNSTCMGAYEIPMTDCEELLDLPKEHKLTYETQFISFTVPYRCDVRVIVTDLQGRLVRNADMTYRDREGKMTVNLADLRLFELDHDPREPFIMTVKTGSKIHVTYLYITRLDKNY